MLDATRGSVAPRQAACGNRHPWPRDDGDGIAVALDRDKVLEAAQKYASKRQFEKAIAEYRKLLAEHPGDDRVLLRIADLQLRMGAHGLSVETLQQVAAAYASGGFTTKAVAVYHQARVVLREHLPSRIDLRRPILQRLAQLYQEQGLTGEVATVLDELATALLAAGEQAQAVESLRQLAQLRRNDPQVLLRLADALHAAGDKRGAASELGALAALHRKAGRHDDAIAVYERLLSEYGEPGVARTLAEMYLDRGAPGDALQALKHLQACFQSTQRDPDTLRVLARALDALGQTARSIEIRKLLLKTLIDASDLAAAKDVASRLIVEAPNDETVRHAARNLGIVRDSWADRPHPMPVAAAPEVAPRYAAHGESAGAPLEGTEDSLIPLDDLEPATMYSVSRSALVPGAAAPQGDLDPRILPPPRFGQSQKKQPPSVTPAPSSTAPAAPSSSRKSAKRSPPSTTSAPQERRVAPSVAHVALEPTVPRRRGELLGSVQIQTAGAVDQQPPSPTRDDAAKPRAPSTMPPDPTIPVRRSALADLEAAPPPSEATIRCRREDLLDTDSFATDPDPTMRFGRSALEATEMPAPEITDGGEPTLHDTLPPQVRELALQADVSDVLTTVDFYEAQHRIEEALSVLEAHLTRIPDHPLLVERYRRLCGQ